METTNEIFAQPVQLSLEPIGMVVSGFSSHKIELNCVTPDKRPIIDKIMESPPRFESQLNKVWYSTRTAVPSYLVVNQISGQMYLIAVSDITELMSQLGNYYRKLTIELFEVYIKCDLNMDDTIATIQFRYT